MKYLNTQLNRNDSAYHLFWWRHCCCCNPFPCFI